MMIRTIHFSFSLVFYVWLTLSPLMQYVNFSHSFLSLVPRDAQCIVCYPRNGNSGTRPRSRSQVFGLPPVRPHKHVWVVEDFRKDAFHCVHVHMIASCLEVLPNASSHPLQLATKSAPHPSSDSLLGSLGAGPSSWSG
jgi:hypothetical protein